MRVLFVQDNGLDESPALTELSALLKARGHETSLVLEREVASLEDAAAAERPDVLILAASILARAWTAGAARRLKARLPRVPVVLAGSFPTLAPGAREEAGADFAVVGEAERPVLGLLDALEGRGALEDVAGLVHPLGRRAPGRAVEDLDTLPPPDRGLYFDRYPFMARFPWKKMLAGRGCFYDCAFCYQPTLQKMTRGGGAVRRKSPARLAAEALALKARWPTTHVHFSDDLFVSDLRWVEGFAEAWKPTGLPYSLNTTADFVTEETAPLLAASGCRSVSIGLETADEALRRGPLGKNVRNAAVERAAALIRAHGMLLTTFNILASPGDTFENALATLKLNASLGVDHARVTLATPLPGTPMAEAMPGGRSRETRYLNLYHLFNLGVAAPALLPLIERLAGFPWPAALAPAGLIRLWQEKRLFGLGWSEGLAYFRHVGMPDKRTANFASLLA